MSRRPVSDCTPEDMFVVHPGAPHGVPIDAITTVCRRTEGVISLLMRSFEDDEGRMSDALNLNMAWGVLGSLGALRSLTDWGHRTSEPTTAAKAGRGSSNMVPPEPAAIDPATPEAMFTVNRAAPAGLPVDAINAAILRAEGVASLLMETFEGEERRSADEVVYQALESLRGSFGEIRTLALWGAQTSRPAIGQAAGGLV